MERSILITGANGGLGSTLVSQLVNSPQSLSTYGIYAVRNTSTAHSLSNILTYTSKSHYELLPVDLSSLESVRAAATCLNQRVSSGEIPQIEALVLNAAVQHVEGRVITVDGFESHFAVNYLANFLFVLMMLESLDKERGRVVVISTAMHDSYHWMNHRTFSAGEKEMFANIETIVRGGEDGETDEEKRMAGMRRYGISKCLLVMFAHQLKNRLNKDSALSRISVTSLDPGGMGGAELTKRGTVASKFLWGYVMPVVQNICVYIWPNGVLRTNAKSASDLMNACFGELRDSTKALYLNGSDRAASSEESQDEDKQDRLWKSSLKLVGLNERDTVLKYWQ